MTDPSEKPQGYMSHKARIYLVRPCLICEGCFIIDCYQADVHDHVEYVLSSLDMFSGISDNLIEYTFNVSDRINEPSSRAHEEIDVFVRDERSDEAPDNGYGHIPASDGPCWILRA